jgi:hypothetical protein
MIMRAVPFPLGRKLGTTIEFFVYLKNKPAELIL